MRGFLDTHTLLTEYDKFTEKQDCKDFLSVWAHMRDKYARALLVLFHISHVIILTHPTHTFDYSYVNLFRAMDIVRLVTGHSQFYFFSTGQFDLLYTIKNIDMQTCKLNLVDLDFSVIKKCNIFMIGRRFLHNFLMC